MSTDIADNAKTTTCSINSSSVLTIIFITLTTAYTLISINTDRYHSHICIIQSVNESRISYYEQWYGSSLVDHKYTNKFNNICNLPTLLFVWNHKTGGYVKAWQSKFKENCNLKGFKNPRKHNRSMNTIMTLPRTSTNHGHITMARLRRHREQRAAAMQSGNPSNPLHHRSHIIQKQTRRRILNKKSLPFYIDFIRNSHKSLIIGVWEQQVFMLNSITAELDQIIGQNYIIIMSVREPLHTILSGYNYHAQGHETIWTAQNLQLYHHRHHDQPLLHCFSNVWDKLDYVINPYSTMYDEYKKGFANNYSDHNALQYGLYLEFTRFVNCEYPLHLSMYNEIKYNNNYRWFLFLRFEWFHYYDYAKSIRYLLDELSINEGMYYNETSLYRDLLELDLNGTVTVNSTTNSTMTLQEYKHHTTKGKYDKDLQIKLLFAYDERICKYIKDMTLEMDGIWTYYQYC